MARETLPSVELSDDPTPVDPLADLLFTLIAAVLPAILLLAPTLHRTPPQPADQPAAPSITVGGRGAETIVAGAEGLRLGGGPTESVALDDIPTSVALTRKLAQLRESGKPLVVVVEPQGLESAFLFEPVAAAQHLDRYALIRAATSCTDTRDQRLAAACGR